MNREDHDPKPSIDHNEAGRATALAVAMLGGVRKWGPATAFAIVAYFALFRLPFQFPPTQLLVSRSYAFGFNNGLAVLAMAILLGAATMYRLCLGDPRACDPLMSFEEDGQQKTRLSCWLFVSMAVLYALLTAVLYVYSRLAATAMLTWESRHFLHRIKLVETYNLRPYVDIQAEYGPALMYPPIYLNRLLAPLGVSVQGAYFLCHLLMNLAGLWCLWYLLRHCAAPTRAKAVAFFVIGIAGFGPWMGLNGVVLRFACPFTAVFIGHRVWMRLRENTSPMREVSMVFTVATLAVVNVLLSPEIAVAFVVGWLSYSVLLVRTDWRILAVSLPALAATAIGCHFLLPTAYFGSLLRFSQGANNLPMVPAGHLVLYVVTLALIVPPLLAASWRSGRADAALLGSLGVLSVVMMPGALGRCDPSHVLFYGLVASMLLMIRLAGVSRGTYRVYVLAYAIVFIGMMQVINLNGFGVSPKDLATNPAQAVRSFIDRQRSEFAPRDHTYLTALDKYPAIGLPFATYGFDNAAEAYLFAHRRVDPEFYVGVVGVYSDEELNRKLADTARHEFLLVNKEWEQPRSRPWSEDYLSDLRRWFLYPARLQVIRPDLDASGAVERFIADHYRAVEDVGRCVVVQRVDASKPPSDKFDKP